MFLSKFNPKNWFAGRKRRGLSRKLAKQTSKLKVIAVTGSAGKTLTAHMLNHVLSQSGLKSACISTAGIWLGTEKQQRDFVINSATPDQFAQEVKTLAQAGVEYLIVEASAHCVVQGKFEGLKFDSLGMTNIGGGDFAEGFDSEQHYAESIFSLLHQVIPEGLVVLNADDDAAEWVRLSSNSIRQNIYADWISKTAVEELNHTISGIKFKFAGGFFDIKGITTLYLEDTLLVIKLASKYVGVNQIDSALNTYTGLAGREEKVQTTPATVIVDYAYHPLVIDMVLGDIRNLVKAPNRVITVIGAAGRRSESRRKVGIPVAKYSDIVLIAAQDPRGEDVAAINSRIAEYAEQFGGVLVERISDMHEFQAIPFENLLDKVQRVIDNNDVPMVAFDSTNPSGRYNAIEFGIKASRPGDAVVILGKGDDEVMDFGTTLYEWSDARAAKDVLEGLNPQ